MIFYHYTKSENVKTILSEGLKLSRASLSFRSACIYLCIDQRQWKTKGDCLLRVNIPDEKVVYANGQGEWNFNGDVLELDEDVPLEWIKLVDSEDNEFKQAKNEDGLA